MNIDFNGQTVLVTGATRGIGAAIVMAFEAAGASLLLTGTNQKEIDELNQRNAQQGKQNVRWLQADFSSALSTTSFLEVIAQCPPIHVLINNAGTNRISLIDDVSAEDLDMLLSVNLRAPLLLCKSVSRAMKQMNYGRIVNIASIWSVVTKPGRVVYSAAKSGLAGMTRSVAVDLAPYGILVNALSPGFVNTELTNTTLSAEEREGIASQVPLGRFAEPEEIARMVLFLSSKMNSYLTGQNIMVDGGFTCV
jgi:3-oxoacyl-[acyl-carrier protein] reductase